MPALAVLRLTEGELIDWGRALGTQLRPPAVVTLEGELGAGKTTLAQAISLGMGVTEAVTSPTFALVHEYAAPTFPVYHLDLYRLRGPVDLEGLAFDELIGGPGVALIEWPERAAGRLPLERRRIRLAHVPGEPRLRLLEEIT